MHYAVVIESGDTNFSAYVPDLPGCVAVGDTLDEVKIEIRDAIRFHIKMMKADGLEVPGPTSYAANVEVGKELELNALSP